MNKSINRMTMQQNSINNRTNMKSMDGSIARMMTEERPNENEVNIKVSIKDIKYGNTQVVEPEITTIYGGSKLTVPVPFKKSLTYGFSSVEDNMVFKYALTSSGDLLGFIYLEIPNKFKAMQDFKLDDWFPVKQVESDVYERVKVENFVARIVINYKAARRLEINKLNPTKRAKAEVYEQMAHTLKEKLTNIHKVVDTKEDEGFKHLSEFQKKLNKKRLMMRTGDKEYRGIQNNKPELQMNIEKERFYAARTMMQDNEHIVEAEIAPKDLYKGTGNRYKPKGNIKEYQEKLLKELTQTKHLLVTAKQELSQIERDQLTVDNIEYKNQLDELKDELMREKAELTIKTKQQTNVFDQEKEKIKQDYGKSKTELDKEREELMNMKSQFEQKLDDLEEREQQIRNTKIDINTRTLELDQKSGKLNKEQIKFLNEKEDLREKDDEIKETTEDLMNERQRIHDELERLAVLKQETDLREQQIKAQEDFLWEERNRTDKDVKKKSSHYNKERQALVTQWNLIRVEKESMDQTESDLKEKLEILADDKTKQNIENVRLWREKSKLQDEIKDFMDWKNMIEKEHNANLDNLDEDYAYIDDQLAILEGSRKDFDVLKENLEEYEKYLEDQHRIYLEQQKRFEILQKQFFEKLGNSQFDVEELREYAQKFGIDFEEAETQQKEDNKLNKEIEKSKAEIQYHIDNITKALRRNTVQERRITNNQRRNSNIANVMNTPDQRLMNENNFKIKKDAEDVLEEMFMQACLTATEADYQGKDDRIREYNMKIKQLEEILNKEREEFAKGKEDLEKKKEQKKEQKLAKQAATVEVNTDIRVEAQYNEEQQLRFQNNNANKHSRVSVVSVLKEPAELEELKEDILDLCEVSLDYLREIAGEDVNTQRYQEREQYIEHSKKCITNIFNAMAMLHNGRQDVDNKMIDLMAEEQDMFDYEILVSRYEAKIKDLVEYIKRIRDNSEFFNPTADNDIIKA